MSIGIMSGMLDGLLHSSGFLATFGISAGTAALIGGGLAAAGSVAGGLLNKPKNAKSPKVDYNKDQETYYPALEKGLNYSVPIEQKFRSQYGDLNMGDTQNFLLGNGQNPGFYSQLSNAYGTAQGNIASARGAEFSTMAGQAGQARGVLQGVSPESAGLVSQSYANAGNSQNLANQFGANMGGFANLFAPDTSRLGSTVGGKDLRLGSLQPNVQQYQLDTANATSLANQAYNRSQGLSQEEQRNADQAAMAMSSQRGRLNDNSSVAAQILSRQGAMDSNRANAMSAANSAFNQQSTAATQQQNNQQALFGQYQAANQQRMDLQNTNLAKQQASFQQNLLGQQQQNSALGQGYDQSTGLLDYYNKLNNSALSSNQQAFNQAQGFYTDPGLTLLGSTPAGLTLGGNYMGTALGQIGNATPKLASPDTAFNLGAANRGNAVQIAAANAQAQASQNAGMMGMMGNIAQGMFQYAGAKKV